MKKHLFKIAIFVIALCSVTSCTVTRTIQVSKESEYTNMFVGKSHNQIVASLGAPDRQTSDGAGGTILIYETITSATTSNSKATAYDVDYFSKTYTPGVKPQSTTSSYTSYAHFFISDSGVCYQVKTNHHKTVTEEDEQASKDLKKFWKNTLKWSGILLGATALITFIATLAGA